MKEMKQNSGLPKVIRLSADWRIAEVNYLNDITWELSLAGGEPEALSLQTTLGLRCGGLRFFPRFVRKEGTLSDPAKFHHPPLVLQVFPSFARVVFSPFSGLEVKAEYQVLSSSVLCGRFWLQNKSILKEQFRFEWVGIFNALGAGQGMAASVMENNAILEGVSGELHLVSCLKIPAQPGSGPYSSLGQDVELFPNAQTSITWAVAAAPTSPQALELAQAAVQRRFEAETARIEIQNQAEEVEISTGNPEWDTALMLTQREARRLFFPPSGGLPAPSFVLNRQVDQGFSIAKDGSDYSPLWSGQTALDAYFISSLILPGGMPWVKGLIRNFLASQDENGQIDWRPGLGGQRSRRLAQPVLASLALLAAETSGETDWLKDVYPGLIRFLRSWFDSGHDRDQDGFPEWDHPLQTGLPDAPIYDRWQAGAQGLDVNVLESPALGAMLVRECASLSQMGRLLGAEADIPWLEEQAARLTAEIQQTWQAEWGLYHYRDHLTHSMEPGRVLAAFTGNEDMRLTMQFPQPQRLLITLEAADQTTRAISIKIRGWRGEAEVVEEISPARFNWVNGRGRSTGRQVFTRLEEIEVSGMMAGDKGWVSLPDYTLEDISLLLPLWAGIPQPEQANAMVETALLQNWLGKYGLPASGQETAGVPMVWNHLVGEGLLRHGFRKQAAELVRRLMEGVVLNLQTHQDYRSQWDAGSGQARGEAGHLHGMAPVGLLLRTAGIHQISPERLIIQAGSPFSHAITVKYKGTEITVNVKEAQITFPSGHSIRVDEPGLHRVEWQ